MSTVLIEQQEIAVVPVEATKKRIEGRRAILDCLKRQSTYDQEKPMSAELRAKTPPVLHHSSIPIP